MEERIITANILNEDNENEINLRPKYLDEYIGQTAAKEKMSIFIEAAKREMKP